MAHEAPVPSELEAWLRERLGDARGITALRSGAWSAAHRFESNGQLLVIKLGTYREDYERDAAAGTWALPDVPIPRVHEVGDAFGGSFSIADFVDGGAFEDLPPAVVPLALDHVLRAYRSLEEVELPGAGFGIWDGRTGDAPCRSWAEQLTSVPDRDDARLRGWRAKLEALPEVAAIFHDAQRELEQLAPQCPELRHVNHGDPLQGNIRVTDAGNLTGVLDWGVSLVGDPIYDLAMLRFCVPWYGGLDAHTIEREARDRAGDDADVRMRACMLHIGLAALQYQAFAGRADDIDQTCRWMVARFEIAH